MLGNSRKRKRDNEEPTRILGDMSDRWALLALPCLASRAIAILWANRDIEKENDHLSDGKEHFTQQRQTRLFRNDMAGLKRQEREGSTWWTYRQHLHSQGRPHPPCARPLLGVLGTFKVRFYLRMCLINSGSHQSCSRPNAYNNNRQIEEEIFGVWPLGRVDREKGDIRSHCGTRD